MAPTVDDLRNEIRVEVGRYERVESTPFTKEALAAIARAAGGEDLAGGRLPAKAEMRATIRHQIDTLATDEASDRPFRKSELVAIATAVAES